jgi:hypothetical protein
MNVRTHRVDPLEATMIPRHAAGTLRLRSSARAIGLATLGLAVLGPLMLAGCANRNAPDAAAASSRNAATNATSATAATNATGAANARDAAVAATAADAGKTLPSIGPGTSPGSPAPYPGSAPPPAADPDTTPAESAPRLHVDRDYGFSITVPARVELRETFTASALDSAQWQYGATAPTSGSARVALVLPGSNNITTAELRVGVSMAPNSVRQCVQIPAGAQKQPGTVTLDRVGFTNFRQEDAGMNHFLTADSYRAVQKGRCYAIDLLVYGTNPQVYNPPATSPFTREQARIQLQKMLPGFRFLR